MLGDSAALVKRGISGDHLRSWPLVHGKTDPPPTHLSQVEAPRPGPHSRLQPGSGSWRVRDSAEVVLEAVSQPGLWLSVDPQVLRRC